MPMWFEVDGRPLPAETLRPGESADPRPVPEQTRDAEYHAFFAHLRTAGQGARTVHEWVNDRRAVKLALDEARRGGLRQLRRAGVGS